MPILSEYARKKKAAYFLDTIPADARVLEIGCASMWVAEYLRARGCTRYTGIDLLPPADIVGDIRQWTQLGLRAQSFDVIIAFEVLEHVDCIDACFQLLKPGGRLMATSPVPSMDWFLKLLERLGLNQKRTSVHSNLIWFSDVTQFSRKQIKTVAMLSQWGIFTRC